MSSASVIVLRLAFLLACGSPVSHPLSPGLLFSLFWLEHNVGTQELPQESWAVQARKVGLSLPDKHSLWLTYRHL